MVKKIISLRNITSIAKPFQNKKMKKVLLILLFLFGLGQQKNYSLIAQNSKFQLKIKQFVSGASSNHEFIISENKLVLLETKINHKGVSKRKTVMKKKISSAKLNELKNSSEVILQMQREYIKAELGGVRWEIELIFKNTDKKIIIENVAIPEIETVFTIINSLIPIGKPILYKY